MAAIRTTHGGSLPRPPEVLESLVAREDGREVDELRLAELVYSGVEEVVRRQRALGIDVIGDGEIGRPSFNTYLFDRISGFGPTSKGGRRGTTTFPDLAEFPEYAKKL